MRVVVAFEVAALGQGALHDAVNDQGHEACMKRQLITLDVVVDGHNRAFAPSWEVAPLAEAKAFCNAMDVRDEGCADLLVQEVHKKLVSNDALSAYLVCRGHSRVEGHTSMFPVSEHVLRSLVSDIPTIRSAIQIGFNAGHSAMTILSANPTVHLTSFDLVEHPYTLKAAAYLDTMFPGRHQLIPGDSTTTVPNAFDSSTTPFDFIFIDGGHTYDVATADLRNCMRVARAGTLVVMDDVVGSPTSWWTEGPTQAWNEAIGSGVVVEIGRTESSRGSPYPTWVHTSRSAPARGAASSGVDGLAIGFYTGSAKSLVDSLLQQALANQ